MVHRDKNQRLEPASGVGRTVDLHGPVALIEDGLIDPISDISWIGIPQRSGLLCCG
jgi:hypothetical protein